MSAEGEVTIAGRVFRLGAAYARRPGGGRGRYHPRRLLSHNPDSPLPGGRVDVEIVSLGVSRVMGGEEWAEWAGAPVEDSLEDVGR
jgi:hypothetical protein